MPRLEKKTFGKIGNGEKAELFTFVNSNGMNVSITNYGGIITKINVPDKYGKIGDVVLGFDNLDEYLSNDLYLGAIIGRNSNRIQNGKLKINNFEYSLPVNNGNHHLHGGIKGFDKVLWNAKELTEEGQLGLELTYTSPDGEEGYPGTMQVKVNYILTDQNELCIRYNATTDQPTICNLTNHTYFNLKDAGKSNILKHQLLLYGDYITPVDKSRIPTGEFLPVDGTAFDFREAKTIGIQMSKEHEQLKLEPRGYDHNYILNGKVGECRCVAVLSELSSGRRLELFTEEPGLQFYSGNFLNGISGKNDIVYEQYSGLCLETQHFPNAPNQPNFPSTFLNPGEKYRTSTVYKFSVVK